METEDELLKEGYWEVLLPGQREFYTFLHDALVQGTPSYGAVLHEGKVYAPGWMDRMAWLLRRILLTYEGRDLEEIGFLLLKAAIERVHIYGIEPTFDAIKTTYALGGARGVLWLLAA